MELFSAASRDRNPLHLSRLYARNTPYGERVVFGVLGGLACLGRCLNGRQRVRLAKVSMEFLNPIYPSIDYSVESAEVSCQEVRVKLRDGKRVVLKAAFQFDESSAFIASDEAENFGHDACAAAHLESARDLSDEELVVGYTTRGAYAPSQSDLRQLVERVGLGGGEIDASQVSALLLSSYIAGMELPGTRALFSKLTLDFTGQASASNGRLNYEATISSFDKRFGFLKIEAGVSAGQNQLARAELRVFVRPQSPAPDSLGTQPSKGCGTKLNDKVALVIGASRGLGAATALALAAHGCTVYINFWRNRAKAEELKKLADGSGRIILLQGDASNLGWCQKMRDIVVREHGKLDYLICNACLPLLPLRIEAGAARRINDYVAQSLALVSVPMAVFLETLEESGGRNVVISSEAIHTAPADWPHYVSAKWAIEGLTRVAASAHERVGFIIVRPPTLATDLLNTPMGRQSAISPSVVANAIVKCLRKSSTSQVRVLENFREPELHVPPSGIIPAQVEGRLSE